jgi:cytoskeletal protein CcmA (bactofilin family)
MFGIKKQPAIRSLVGEGTRLQGELQFTDGLRIDGEIVGDVIATGNRSIVVISEKARVQGRVKASHVIINGTVEGPVESDELLELQPKARVVGDVHYASLEMHQGATIDGELHPMIPAEAKPALKLAAANDA